MINFTAILSDLQAAIAVVAARDRALTVLLVAVWGGIGRMRGRLGRLIARWRAGTLPAPRKSRAGEVRGAPSIRIAFPTAPAWLLVRVRAAVAARSQVEHLLAQAEYVAFLAAVPQARRILRPLCRMLGIGVAPSRVKKPRPVWEMPRDAPGVAQAGLVIGPDGRVFFV